MKKITQLAICSLLLTGVVSCKKEELGSRELFVFVKGDFGNVNNTITASLTQTPLAVWGVTSFDIPAYATREVPEDVNVTIQADETQVSQFNTIAGTNCVVLPANSYTVNASQRTIKAGSLQSDPITITLTNAAALTDPNGYVLPLRITKIEGKDKGVAISNNKAVAYLHIPYKYTNVDSVEVPLSGSSMSRTGWSVTVSNTTSGSLGPAMLDGSNTTQWRSSNSSSAAKWVVLNMGSPQTIKGFTITPNYASVSENATQIRISTSLDNVAYTDQGTWKGTGPASGSSSTNPDFKGVNFISPVQAQYFRFDITAWVSGSRVGIAELNANQ